MVKVSVDKFLQQDHRPASRVSIAVGGRPVAQVPPMERGELAAFLSTSRGTSNIIAPTFVPERTTALDDVWKTSLYGKAPQVPAIDPKGFKQANEDGTVRIVRYLPERFERCRVQRPEMIEDTVDAKLLADDGARLMHPTERRRIHDTFVNSMDGERALRESLRTRSKLMRTCCKNFPHGALGISESPYRPNAGEAYPNAEALQLESRAAARRSKGGQAPPSTIGSVLQHVC
jgi:hypothetical protein